MDYEKKTKKELAEKIREEQTRADDLQEKLFWEKQKGVSQKASLDLVKVQNEKEALVEQINKLLETIKELEAAVKEQEHTIKSVEEYLNYIESFVTQSRVSLEIFTNLKDKTLKEIIGGK